MHLNSITSFSLLTKGIYVILSMLIMLYLIGCTDQPQGHQIEMGQVTDIEGNIYNTVKIGNQWWMAENLRVTSFNSGEAIERLDNSDTWANTNQPAYSVYNNISGPGLLYNFHVVNNIDQIAPAGWRVPTDNDWKELEEFLGMSVQELELVNWRGTVEGDLLKEKTTNTTGWISYSGVWGTDAFGFNAIGGSCRVFNGEWGVPGLRQSGYWWSSSVINGYGWFRYLDYKRSGIFRYSAEPNYGFSIRCVKDE